MGAACSGGQQKRSARVLPDHHSPDSPTRARLAVDSEQAAAELRQLAAAEAEGSSLPAPDGGERQRPRLLLLGASGVGKTTLARLLELNFGGELLVRRQR